MCGTSSEPSFNQRHKGSTTSQQVSQQRWMVNHSTTCTRNYALTLCAKVCPRRSLRTRRFCLWRIVSAGTTNSLWVGCSISQTQFLNGYLNVYWLSSSCWRQESFILLLLFIKQRFAVRINGHDPDKSWQHGQPICVLPILINHGKVWQNPFQTIPCSVNLLWNTNENILG